MISKIVAVVAVFSLVTVSAASPLEGLKKSIRNYTYAVTVEWDQHDQKFYDKQVEKLGKSIKDAKKAGFSNKQIMNALFADIKDERGLREIRDVLSVVDSDKFDAEETILYIKEKIESNRQTGASWRGLALSRNLILIGVLTGIALIIIFSFNEDDEEEMPNDCVVGDFSLPYICCDQECEPFEVPETPIELE